MLLPAKHIRLSESIIALSAMTLRFLDSSKTVDQLWSEIKQINNSSSFLANHSYDNFLLSIDYLYMVGIINSNQQGKLFLCN